MSTKLQNAELWSTSIFGNCSLGDKRLTNRLIKIGTQLCKSIGSSFSKSCEGVSALVEGGYRFIRNERVSATSIANSGYAATANMAKDSKLLLAIEDTTTLSYTHGVSKELGYTSNSRDSKKKGILVHSTMLMDAKKEKTIGLIAQERWVRDSSTYGKRHERKKRPYHEKESYKWERNTREVEQRLGEKIKDTISICDREADIYEYISYKLEHNQRFIVRAKQDRKLSGTTQKLFRELCNSKLLGEYSIQIAQKSNRKKREAEIELRVKQVTLMPPERRLDGENQLKPITLNVVVAREKAPNTEEILEWVLLTSEPITTFKEVRELTRFYELRWRIEDFHKAWKSGAGVEKQRMQSYGSLEVMAVILSFVAIRLLQLKEHFDPDLMLNEKDICISCDLILTNIEWKVLWATVEKKRVPTKPPSASWAYQAIAKLGGWTNSKGTGKVSWATMWDGWFKLNERIEGYLAVKELGV